MSGTSPRESTMTLSEWLTITEDGAPIEPPARPDDRSIEALSSLLISLITRQVPIDPDLVTNYNNALAPRNIGAAAPSSACLFLTESLTDTGDTGNTGNTGNTEDIEDYVDVPQEGFPVP